MKTAMYIFIFFHTCIFSQSDWVKLNTGTSANIYSVFFTDANTGYASLGQSLLKTTNGGLNWIILDPAGITYLGNIYFLNSETGFSSSSGIYKTTDGGISYIQVNTIAYYTKISFVNSNTGFSISDEFLKTTNQGASWYSIPIPPGFGGVANTGCFINENTGIVGYSHVQHPNNVIYFFKTTNGGSSWQQVYFANGFFALLNSVSVNNTVYIGYTGGVYRSSNSGQTWAQYAAPNYNVRAIAFINEGTGFFCGEQNSFYRSTNSGVNWQFIPTDTVTNFSGIHFPTQSVGYLCGTGGVIFKTTNAGGTLGVTLLSNEIPKEFSLGQNYPNPFNPQTQIKFDIAKHSNVRITVYDIAGRLVTTLVNENLKPANYEIKFEGSGLSSGAYFYKIEAGEFITTKKMLLVK